MNSQQSEQLLTAYVLNELDEISRKELDEALSADPYLRERLAEIQKTLEVIRNASQTAGPGLSPEHMDVLRAAASNTQAGKKKWRHRPIRVKAGVVFVIIVICTFVASVLMPGLSRSRELAKQASRQSDLSRKYRETLEQMQEPPQPVEDRRRSNFDEVEISSISVAKDSQLAGRAPRERRPGPGQDSKVDFVMRGRSISDRLEKTDDTMRSSGMGGNAPAVSAPAPYQVRGYAMAPVLGETGYKAPEPSSKLRKVEESKRQIDLDAPVQEQVDRKSTFAPAIINPWTMTGDDPFSTFSSDVDTASYNLCRSYLRSGYLPPANAVRVEEFVNAFDYNYPRRAGGVFNIFVQGSPNPFDEPGQSTCLLKIGVQGRVVGREGRKSAHLVFVVDTSGSMAKPERLGLIQHAITLLAEKLDTHDRLTLITCNRDASLVLECVGGANKQEILQAVKNLRPGGPTNLHAGLRAGYEMAKREFVAGRINRIILCTDGAANIGQIDAREILTSVEQYRNMGITLTVAGLGYGGYNDDLLETLAKSGDGNYVFIDTAEQAQESLVDGLAASLQTIAFDSRIQVEFNPSAVRRYRLIGYDKRQIADEDFRKDNIRAAHVTSGQSATALYELELAHREDAVQDNLLATVRVRYRNADSGKMEEISHPVTERIISATTVSQSPRFYLGACAARFAEILRESPYARKTDLKKVKHILDGVCRELYLDNRARELSDLVKGASGLQRAPS